MQILVGLLIAGMIIFAVGSATREIGVYRKSLQGSREYLVSKRRRNRRILIAGVLILEAILLFLGVYVLNFTHPIQALLYWLPPLLLIIWLVHLGVSDFRETSRDLDIIVRETSEDFLKRRDAN